MGAVHGVYLKYVALSIVSYGGYISLVHEGKEFATTTSRSLLEWNENIPLWKLLLSGTLFYSAVLNGVIAILFKLRRGMTLLGKDPVDGSIPLWSYILYYPFHFFTWLYTMLHFAKDGLKSKKVPAATEVQPGWFVGGRYSDVLNQKWGGVIDLTSEFPESCINHTQKYMLIPLWDGVPPTPAQLEEAAQFAVEARKLGSVLIHCAHGRGRSTTTMCAALVKAGLFSNWAEAFEKGIKPARPVCKLNSAMKLSLTEWQKLYVDSKKAT